MPSNKDITAATGRAIYKEKILPLMKEEDKGKVVVIDVNSGDYEIDYDDAAAMFRLLERRPDGFYMGRARRLPRRASHGVCIRPSGIESRT